MRFVLQRCCVGVGTAICLIYFTAFSNSLWHTLRLDWCDAQKLAAVGRVGSKIIKA